LIFNNAFCSEKAKSITDTYWKYKGTAVTKKTKQVYQFDCKEI
jgi:hypothetical protein